MKILNWGLMKNPHNWVVITLMLVIAGIAGHLALTYFGVEPASSNDAKTLPDQITPSSAPVNLRWDGTFQATPSS